MKKFTSHGPLLFQNSSTSSIFSKMTRTTKSNLRSCKTWSTRRSRTCSIGNRKKCGGYGEAILCVISLKHNVHQSSRILNIWSSSRCSQTTITSYSGRRWPRLWAKFRSTVRNSNGAWPKKNFKNTTLMSFSTSSMTPTIWSKSSPFRV